MLSYQNKIVKCTPLKLVYLPACAQEIESSNPDNATATHSQEPREQNSAMHLTLVSQRCL